MWEQILAHEKAPILKDPFLPKSEKLDLFFWMPLNVFPIGAP